MMLGGINATPERSCSRCHGAGHIKRRACGRCGGTGIEPTPIDVTAACPCGTGRLHATAYPGDGPRVSTVFCAWCEGTFYLTHEGGVVLAVLAAESDEERAYREQQFLKRDAPRVEE